MRRCIELIFIICATAVGNGYSQSNTDKINIALGTGVTQYYGDLRNGILDFGNSADFFVGASLSFYLDPMFDIVLTGNTGTLGYEDDANTRFSADMSIAYAGIRFKANNGDWLEEDAKFAPYVLAGVGIVSIQNNNFENGNSIISPIAVGFNLRVARKTLLRMEALWEYSDLDLWDGEGGDLHDSFLQLGIMAAYNFGGGIK